MSNTYELEYLNKKPRHKLSGLFTFKTGVKRAFLRKKCDAKISAVRELNTKLKVPDWSQATRITVKIFNS